jgi:hypothetical protein
MTRPTDSPMFDQRIADWLEDDPTAAPAQLLETVRAAVPSIPQRRPAVRWRPWTGSGALRFAVIAAALLIVAILGGMVIKLPSVGPSNPPVPSGLTNRVDVPLHFYSIVLPPDWTVRLATGTGRPDLFEGPEGSLTATFALLPAGSGQDAWGDAYVVDRVARRSPGCTTIDPASFEMARVGTEAGRLYTLSCKPELLAMTAIGDRGFDFEFSARGGVSPADAAHRFADILLEISFDQGPTPQVSLSQFTSARYGFSIGYPTGWKVTVSTEDLGPFDIPWGNGPSVDLIEGSGVGEPGQPSDGTLDLSAADVPVGTTMDDVVSTVVEGACGPPATTQDITVDGKPGKLFGYANCRANFHQWVVVLDGTRVYHVLWLNAPGTEGFDRVVFEQILGGFHLRGSVAPTPAQAAQVPEALIGAWHHPAPGWWWFLRAGDPECVQAVRTDLDCVVWQRGTSPQEIGIATMSGNDLMVAWRSGYCTGITSNYTVALTGDSLNLIEHPGGCEGGNLALTRAGTGSTPTAPAPPTP